MAYRHHQDHDGSCSRMGRSAEHRFVSTLSKLGFAFEPATLEGQFNHKDFHLDFDGSVDVKARKRISRADTETQDDLVWLEFCNGRGAKGWLDGKATWIAFEITGGFVVFERTLLRDWAYCHTRRDITVKTPAEAKGKLYRRGLAEITLQPMKQMRKDLPHIFIKA